MHILFIYSFIFYYLFYLFLIKNSVILLLRYHNQIGVWINIMFIKDIEAEGILLEETKQFITTS